MKRYDAIIIGAGQAGIPLARKLAGDGLHTAIIEKRLIGGTCINDGCTPTKTMIASGRVAHLVTTSAAYGIVTAGSTVDMPAIKKRKDDMVTQFRKGAEKSLDDTNGIDVICGEAAFKEPKIIRVTLPGAAAEELTADKIFIDTGTRPLIPEIAGVHDVGYLTSTTILDLDIVPEHLLIIGSGYIALEFGQLFRRLGSTVTVLAQSAHFPQHEADDVAAEIKQILEREGIAIQCNAVVSKLAKTAGDRIEATVEADSGIRQIHCTHLLIAAGRTPQTEALQLEKAGVVTNKHGSIEVSDTLETNVPGIYALGDVKGGPQFTHIAYNDHLIVYRNLYRQAGLSVKDRIVPYCMFTDPQLGRVGITEKEAREQGLVFTVAKLPMTSVARALETNETRGFMKAIVDAQTKKILGAAVIGVEGGEIMSVLQMAMMGGVTYEQIRYGVFAHPTFSESLNNLFMTIMK